MQTRKRELLLAAPRRQHAVAGDDAVQPLVRLPLFFISGVFVLHDQMPVWGR